jgi:guanosine-3',5'-bis(diphosphate) 3'-pyrophosphohydrolase
MIPIYNDTLLQRAKAFAIKAHGTQTYGDEFPYAIHLQAVDSVLLRFFSYQSELVMGLRVCAWLHDVLEDTSASYEELVTFFGEGIAQCVASVTEPKGGNRKWRHEQTYPQIVAFGDNAIILKLADRIANVESGGKKVQMYRKEHAEFKSMLYRTDFPDQDPNSFYGVMRRMQDHLDDLIVKV